MPPPRHDADHRFLRRILHKQCRLFRKHQTRFNPSPQRSLRYVAVSTSPGRLDVVHIPSPFERDINLLLQGQVCRADVTLPSRGEGVLSLHPDKILDEGKPCVFLHLDDRQYRLRRTSDLYHDWLPANDRKGASLPVDTHDERQGDDETGDDDSSTTSYWPGNSLLEEVVSLSRNEAPRVRSESTLIVRSSDLRRLRKDKQQNRVRFRRVDRDRVSDLFLDVIPCSSSSSPPCSLHIGTSTRL